MSIGWCGEVTLHPAIIWLSSPHETSLAAGNRLPQTYKRRQMVAKFPFVFISDISAKPAPAVDMNYSLDSISEMR